VVELLERADELAALDAVIANAGAGRGGLTLIEGAAGIGKSSLLAAGRTRAADAGLLVLHARATEIERPFGYGIVRQLFDALVRTKGKRDRASLFDGAAAPARQIFEPEHDLAPPGDDVEFTLLHALYWLALNVAEERPGLVAIDDLHWADTASVRWLAYLVRRLEGAPVAVLATLRPIADEDLVIAELAAEPGTTRIMPTALTRQVVASLVRAELTTEADDAFCDACHRATGGNPLLLRELIRTVAAEAIPPSKASVDTVQRLAPGAVARSVRLRLARVPADAGALAHAVAILGDGAEHRDAVALAGLERSTLPAAASALAGADLLSAQPPLGFVHPVVRNAVYESRPAYERMQDHARAAALLAAGGAAPERIASQVLLAPPESVPDAIPALRQAAARAAAEGAHESAVRYLRRALEEPVPGAERATLLLTLGASEFRIGSPDVLAHLREAIELLDDPELLVRAKLELGRVLYWAGQEDDGVAVLEAAVAERGDADDELQHRLEAELIANASRSPAHHERARQRLAALDVSVADGPGARMLLVLRAYHAGAQGHDRDAAVDCAREVLAAMDDDERAWNFIGPAYTLLFADQLDEALQAVDRALAALRVRGAVIRLAGASLVRGIAQYARGELGEAEADLHMALDAVSRETAWSVPHACGWLAQTLVARGNLDDAARVLGETTDGTDDPFARTPLLRARSLLAAARGDHRAALDDALAVGHALAAYGHVNPATSYPSWRSMAALAHHALGEPVDALALAREDVTLARAWGAPRPLARALSVLGVLEGLEPLREAAAMVAASPARLERAQVATELGAALRRGNRRADAREVLRTALELAQRCGAEPLAVRAREELVATGARPRRAVVTGVAALTPTERRTAALAADGLTNKEIAQTLFVTLRTVEMHLSNTFRKLGVASRTQLADALA
jgi:DNA-binding CsgD family transcriptional regulator